MRTIIILMAVGMKVSISCILHGGMRVCIFKLYKSKHLNTSNRYFITWCFTSENLNKVEGKPVMIGYDVLVIGAKKKKKHILKPYFERVCLLLNLMSIDFLWLKRCYFERVHLLLKLSRHSFFLDLLGLRRGYFERICLWLNLMSHSHLLDLLGLLG